VCIPNHCIPKYRYNNICARITGEGRISVRWMKSLTHCSTRVAMRAQDRLSPRLRNQRVLQARDAVNGVNEKSDIPYHLIQFVCIVTCDQYLRNSEFILCLREHDQFFFS
jgi:hypothetical protein